MLNNKIQFSRDVEISKPSKSQQRQRMVSYARSFKGIRQNRERREK